MSFTIQTYFITPNGEECHLTETEPGMGGWDSLAAMKRDRLPYYRKHPRATFHELPDGFRVIEPVRGEPSTFKATEVRIRKA